MRLLRPSDLRGVDVRARDNRLDHTFTILTLAKPRRFESLDSLFELESLVPQRVSFCMEEENQLESRTDA